MTSLDHSPLGHYCAALAARYHFNNKVLLVQLPQFMLGAFSPEVVKRRGAYIWPPTGIQWLYSKLQGRGLDIKLLDLNFLVQKQVHEDPDFHIDQWLDLLDAEITAFDPSVVGVSTINISADPEDPNYPLTAALQHLSAKDDRIILAGGPNAGNDCQHFLEKGLAHIITKGEGDLRVPRIFDLLQGKASPIAPSAGIFFAPDGLALEDGTDFVPVSPQGEIIDSYDQIPVEDYCRYGSLNPFSRMRGPDVPFATIQLNRGCRADCDFCGVTEFMGGRGIRAIPATDTLKEVDYLVKERGIRHFELLDDDFLGKRADRRNLIDFLKGLVALKQDYDISWSAGNGLIASSLDEELLSLIQGSGCIGFRIGIESGNDEMIRKMRKPGSLRSLLEAGQLLQHYPDIFVGGNYILGLFGEETFRQMLDTFHYARAMNIDWANYTVFQFTHTSETKEKKVKTFGASDFVPSKDSNTRNITADDTVLDGIDVFDLPLDAVPDREQVRHIWLTFNVVSNYIDNKNLHPGGNPAKFANWVEAIYISYPDNCYMPLFAGLALVLTGEDARAADYFRICRESLAKSELWQQRFDSFGLSPLAADPPTTPEDVYARLSSLRNSICSRIPLSQDAGVA